MRITIDGDRCEGTGFCAHLAPDLFSLDGGPPVVGVSRELDAYEEAQAREAEDLCPTRAISLREAAADEGR